jgi:NAD(P)-dependent dehydrogenase (short-subunit alcohol dehydrogenase family)
MNRTFPTRAAGLPSGEGRVINFGSLARVTGLAGYGPYNMAREAVRALSRTAARE